jgi:hypothetical protein
MTAPAISDEAHARRIARIKADRKAAGKPELIEDESVYRLLGAVADANAKRIPPARYSTRQDARTH